MDDDKEEKKMAVLELAEQYALEEQAAKKIISTLPVKLLQNDVFNDLDLNDKERTAHARSILKGRKCK